MPKKAAWPPPIYERRGRDYVRLRINGVIRDVTLGPSGSAEARAEYARILAEMETSGRTALPVASLTVAQLAATHLQWSDERYERRQASRVATALRPVVALYGHRPAVSFGPLALETVRACYVREGYCRKLCNQMAGCVRLAWKRAAAQELVPHAVSAALYDLAGLRRRQEVAGVVPIDHPEIPPVEDSLVEATLPHLGRIVGDMVRVQRLTGMRPGEVCALRPGDVDRGWKRINGVEIWLYRLDEHKNDWRGQKRWVPMGPQAQAILLPYLERGAEVYCFSPAEARAEWHAAKRASRKSRVQPSQVNRAKKTPKKMPGVRYSAHSYGHAIARACRLHGLTHWTANQLRHAALTAIELDYSQEDARCVGGHATASTTAIYARGVERAARVLAEIG